MLHATWLSRSPLAMSMKRREKLSRNGRRTDDREGF
jgi:hypothetical protein